MPGFVSSQSNNEEAVFAHNADFSGSTDPSELNGLQTNGQLWIGATAVNAGGTHINRGLLTSPDASITIGYSSPNITLTASPAGSFAPNATVNIFDDFIGSDLQVPASGTSLIDSLLSWQFNSGTLAAASGTTGHPGIISFAAATGDINFRLLNDASGSFGYPFLLGGGVLSCTWIINVATLSTGTNSYTLYSGLGDGTTTESTNGTYFVYSNGLNSGNWSAKTAAGGSRTTVNSAIPVTTGWHKLTATTNAAATSVEFFVDGVSIGSSVSNIPKAGGQEICPFFHMDYAAGTIPAQALQVDLFYLSQTLTTAR